MRLHSLFLDEAQKRIQTASLFEQLQCRYTKEVNNLKQKVVDLTEQLKLQKRQSEERFRSFVHVTDNYVQLQHSTRNMRRRIDHFTNLPLGFHARKQKRQSVELLANKGGARKRRL